MGRFTTDNLSPSLEQLDSIPNGTKSFFRKFQLALENIYNGSNELTFLVTETNRRQEVELERIRCIGQSVLEIDILQ